MAKIKKGNNNIFSSYISPFIPKTQQETGAVVC